MSFNLRQGFQLGVASAATQIEGGDCGHNWNDWYKQGKILDGTDPKRANQHYEKWREDADIMVGMGIKSYRFGIEWARICPTETTVDLSAIAHYREEITYLQNRGISLLMTIHHFTNPMWFEEKGGFTRSENIKHYMDFVALVVRSFGDLISEYITINEPNVYATNSFYFGSWPPGEKSFGKAITVMSNMAVCHIQAYQLIHQMRKEMGFVHTKVSFANHLRVFEPANPWNPWHCTCSFLLERFFQGAATEALCLGKFKWPLKMPIKVAQGEYCDFIAVNYYTRSTISGFGDGVKEGVHKNDLGWEIYPEGIVKCAEKVYNLIKRPIYITENGTCDNHDLFRCKYIYHHLKILSECDLPVERYYHWCFCDNFEWIEGEHARFGLVHIDYASQKRTVKKSGRFYSEVIQKGGVTQEMYDKYIAVQ